MKKKLLTFSFSILCNISYAQWISQNAGFTNKTLGFYEFSIVNKNTVWAICYDGIGGLFGSNPILDFTRTINGGNTWLPGKMGSDTTLAFSNICALSDKEAWVAMHEFVYTGGGGGLFHTTDGGLNWTQSHPGTVFDSTSYPNFVHFKDPMHGIAGGDATYGYFEIYTTNDGGATWTRTPQANIPNYIPNGQYGWFDGFAVIGDTVWFGTSAGQIYKSVDYGLTWTVHTLSAAQETVYEIAFNDDGQHGIAHVRNTNATKLFSTSDGGLSWTQIPTATIPFWKQSRICAVPGTNKFVSTSVNGGGSMGSSYSTDNGVTWTLIESSKQKAACRFLDSTTGWAGGFFNDNPSFQLNSGIYKWDNSPTNNSAITFEHLIGEIFPNPSTGKVNIKLKNGVGSYFHVQVTDIAGQIIEIPLVEITQADLVSFDMSNLRKGLYHINIISKYGITSKKVHLQ